MASQSSKTQLNVSVGPQYADLVRDIASREGRKLWEVVERMISVYNGSPSDLLDRLKRFNRQSLTAQDKAALREIQDYAAFMLMADR